MFDCGVHPAHSGMSCLPYFDHINPAEVGIPVVILSKPSILGGNQPFLKDLLGLETK